LQKEEEEEEEDKLHLKKLNFQNVSPIFKRKRKLTCTGKSEMKPTVSLRSAFLLNRQMQCHGLNQCKP
jgi:hypothetical protein